MGHTFPPPSPGRPHVTLGESFPGRSLAPLPGALALGTHAALEHHVFTGRTLAQNEALRELAPGLPPSHRSQSQDLAGSLPQALRHLLSLKALPPSLALAVASATAAPTRFELQ